MSIIIGFVVFLIGLWVLMMMIESGAIWIVLGGVVIFVFWVATNQHNTPVDTTADCKRSVAQAYSQVPHTASTYTVYNQYFHDCEQSNSQ